MSPRNSPIEELKELFPEAESLTATAVFLVAFASFEIRSTPFDGRRRYFVESISLNFRPAPSLSPPEELSTYTASTPRSESAEGRANMEPPAQSESAISSSETEFFPYQVFSSPLSMSYRRAASARHLSPENLAEIPGASFSPPPIPRENSETEYVSVNLIPLFAILTSFTFPSPT